MLSNAKRILSRPGADLGQSQAARSQQAEPAATGFLDAQTGLALLEPLAQQDQPGVEVLGMRREPQRGIEPQFARGELVPPGRGVVADQPPQDRTRDTLDEVIVVKEDALVL